jgi:hypothetical protein
MRGRKDDAAVPGSALLPKVAPSIFRTISIADFPRITIAATGPDVMNLMSGS